MKTRLFLCLLLLTGMTVQTRAEKTVMEILMSHVWYEVEDITENETWYNEFINSIPENMRDVRTLYFFTQDSIKFQRVGRHYQGRVFSNPWYFSDTPDIQFDASKVAKATNGRYIIERRTGSAVLIWDIIHVDETEMTVLMKYFSDSRAVNDGFIRKYRPVE